MNLLSRPKNKSKMFEFVDDTKANFLGGPCKYECVYCWARALCRKHNMKKYQGEIRLDEKTLKLRFKPGSIVFFCDMLDWLCPSVRMEHTDAILEVIAVNPETRFLSMTKNPLRYYWLNEKFPANIILGATIESNRDYPKLSKAPIQTERIKAMVLLAAIELDQQPQMNLPRFVTIEPILDFDVNDFLCALRMIKPWAVAVGYDNYNNKLPEPPLEKTEALIVGLEAAGIRVYKKTLRRAWNE